MAKKTTSGRKSHKKRPTSPIRTVEQGVLIDVDHPADKEIRELALATKEADDERGKHQDKAEQLRDQLLEVMHKHELTHWTKGDLVVTVSPKAEKVSIKRKRPDAA